MRGLERQDVAHVQIAQSQALAAILAIEVISNHRAKSNVSLNGSLYQLERNFELGAKRRILLAFGKVVGWGVRFKIDRIVDMLVCPQAGHRNDAIVGFAQVGQVLSANMGGFLPFFPITVLIDDQYPLSIGGRAWLFEQHLQAALLDLLFLPTRFREKPLHALRTRVLCSHRRLGVGQSGQRFIAFGWQEQARPG
jgi:hypothetical protein